MAVTPRDVVSTNELDDPERARLLDLLCSAKSGVICDEGEMGQVFAHSMVPTNSRTGLARPFFFRRTLDQAGSMVITTED